MKTTTLLLLVLPTVLFADPAADRSRGFTMPTAAKEQKIVTADEMTRKWQEAETRSLNAPPAEDLTTKVSAAHLAALQKSGATRGISVVAAEGGQSQVTVSVNPASSVSFKNILFKLNSTELADEASVKQVEQIAAAIKASSGKLFVLEGHSCDLGGDAHNQNLSERRAAAILTLLGQRGVNPAQLLPLGFGESRPAVPNTSDANREENRRVVISLRAS